MINSDTHVYCTDCKYLAILKDDFLDNGQAGICPFEVDCDISNFEDSKPFSERPMYQSK